MLISNKKTVMACEYQKWLNNEVVQNSFKLIVNAYLKPNTNSIEIVECDTNNCPVKKILNMGTNGSHPEIGMTGENLSNPNCPVVGVNLIRMKK